MTLNLNNLSTKSVPTVFERVEVEKKKRENKDVKVMQTEDLNIMHS